jgi:hypothetical protein
VVRVLLLLLLLLLLRRGPINKRLADRQSRQAPGCVHSAGKRGDNVTEKTDWRGRYA